MVYAKRPFGGPDAVFSYLGRFTHRVAIFNARLIDFEGGQVTFATKNGGKVTVGAETFIRRFLLHVLPKGFVKLRHYGLLSPSHATTTLELAKMEIESCSATEQNQHPSKPKSSAEMPHYKPVESIQPRSADLDWTESLKQLTGLDVTLCPRCGASMFRVGLHVFGDVARLPEELDSS